MSTLGPIDDRAKLIRGDLITMDPARPRVGAIGAVGGRVVAVGEPDEVAAALPAGHAELRLPGTTVPGMIDSHVHMLWGGRDMERLDVAGAGSVEELLDRVAEFAAGAARERPWIEGRAAIDPEDLAEGRFPTPAELDRAAGGKPVFLDRRSHDAIVGAAALREAGIDRDTPDPEGGRIERDADGEPTGLLIERPAAELVERHIPAPTGEDRRRWLAQIQPHLLAAGITSVVDPALGGPELLAYQEAARAGELSLRVTGMPLGDGERRPGDLAAEYTALGVDLAERSGERWRIGSWKLFLDGGGSLGTALLDRPWPGTEDYYGNQTTSTEALFEYARWAVGEGIGIGVHAVGSAAIELVLEACEEAARMRPLTGLGFTLIHAYLWPSPEQMERARRLDLLVATQSPLQWSFGPGLVKRFGEEAIGRAHPLASWLRSGAIVGGGSDGGGHGDPFPPDPLWAFWQMRRRTIAGREDPVGPDEAIDAAQALALYTTGAAAVALAPDRGQLVPGAVADLAALGVDPLAASPEECREAPVLATVVGGELAYEG